MQAVVTGALDVAKNTFDESKMTLTRIMHMQADLLHGVCNVRSCECQPLQCSRQLPVLRWIRYRCATSCWQLRLDVDRCRDRSAIGHASTIKQVFSILSLREAEAACRPGDLDPKEEVKVAHVLDSKLSLELGDDVLKKSRRGSRDDHVVDVQV